MASVGRFPGGSYGKASAYNAGDPGSIPGSGRSPGEGNGNPLQYSCLENPTDRGIWWATVHGVAKSRTQLSDFTFFPFFLLLQSTGPSAGASVVGAHGLSCSKVYEIFPDQGSIPCPLHGQVDSLSLDHQKSPPVFSRQDLLTTGTQHSRLMSQRLETSVKGESIPATGSQWDLGYIPNPVPIIVDGGT